MPAMGDWTQNFSASEFACPCCGTVKGDLLLVDSLQMLRNMVGQPIHINSGYRCKKHNAEVGGASSSQHLVGKAADIVIEGFPVPVMYRHVLRVPAFAIGGIGVYPDKGFVHVDVRGRMARWAQAGGKDVSIESIIQSDVPEASPPDHKIDTA